MAEKLPFLRVAKTTIVDEAGKPILLKGVSLGGWLMMEGYMLAGRNIPEKVFREGFEKTVGKDALDDFTRSFRDAFIQEKDIKAIKAWGANCIRIPFNYRLIEFEDRPFSLNEEGLSYLDRAIDWCEKNSIYCILDLHAAPGSQNPGWHSDCSGSPEFFTNELNQNRYIKLWYFLADRYKDSSAVAGYDVLNEPVVKIFEEGLVRSLYERVIKEIRYADKKHIIFLEGNQWAQRLNFLRGVKDGNLAYSIHVYVPLDFSHNFEIGLHYPGKVYGITWNKESLDMLAGTYLRFINRNKAPLYLGEFGVNARDDFYGENRWVADLLYICKKYNISWTYWTYKTVANYTYPDGILRYLPNPPWVNRQGPVFGWETFPSLWPSQKEKMVASWDTNKFTLNEKLFKVLKRYF